MLDWEIEIEIHEAYLTKVAHCASFCSWRESGLFLIHYAVRTNQGLSLDDFRLGKGCHLELDCAAVVGVGRDEDVVGGRRGADRPMTTDTVSCCAKTFSRASAFLFTTTQPKSNDK